MTYYVTLEKDYKDGHWQIVAQYESYAESDAEALAQALSDARQEYGFPAGEYQTVADDPCSLYLQVGNVTYDVSVSKSQED